MQIRLNEVEKQIWRDELEDFLPARIFDIHTHLWSEKHCGNCPDEKHPLRSEVTAAGLRKITTLLYPGRKMHFVFLGTPLRNIDFAAHNNWLLQQTEEDPLSKTFILTTPQMSNDYLLKKAGNPCCAGLKPYLIYAEKGMDAAITDFIPERQLEAASAAGLAIMLHMSQNQGPASAQNLKDLVYLSGKYPKIRWILAHCARGFNSNLLEKGIDTLKKIPNLFFDNSAVTDTCSHYLLLKKIDRKKIFYGSDLLAPAITRGIYAAYGLGWGLYSGNPASPCGGEAAFLTYEQLRAFRKAAQIVKLNDHEKEDLFFNNAINFFKEKQSK